MGMRDLIGDNGIVVAIIAILASLLLPGLGRARGQARTAQCAGNQRQIGLAIRMYLDDNESMYSNFKRYQTMTYFNNSTVAENPAGSPYGFQVLLDSLYMNSKQSFMCPSSTYTGAESFKRDYSFNTELPNWTNKDLTESNIQDISNFMYYTSTN